MRASKSGTRRAVRTDTGSREYSRMLPACSAWRHHSWPLQKKFLMPHFCVRPSARRPRLCERVRAPPPLSWAHAALADSLSLLRRHRCLRQVGDPCRFHGHDLGGRRLELCARAATSTRAREGAVEGMSGDGSRKAGYRLPATGPGPGPCYGMRRARGRVGPSQRLAPKPAAPRRVALPRVLGRRRRHGREARRVHALRAAWNLRKLSMLIATSGALPRIHAVWSTSCDARRKGGGSGRRS